jgi:hypothetical protein
MPKTEVEHVDILGQPLALNNYVAVPHHNGLHICSIIKITPKQLRVLPLQAYSRNNAGWLKYPSETVLLSGPDAMVYILKHGGPK